uniref:C2H2-type domain-containing protein n=1 Tax=Schistocephalus solidus TaxID=70667 RepID=A0A0X3PJE3_SCHSO
MNLHANFMQLWSAKFPSCTDSIPRLDCLKADQFLTVNEQRAALEIAHSEVLSSTENLRAALTQQMFIADYLRSCITKLGAVSKVFSELEENGELDGNMSVCEATSATTSDRAPLKSEPPQQQQQQTPVRTSRCPTPTGTPATMSTTGTTVSTTAAALNLSTSAPPLPLLPSFLQTASPLLSAASRNFLFQSAISKSSMEQMKKGKTTADNTTAACTPPLTSTSNHEGGDVGGSAVSQPPAPSPSALPNVTVEEAVRRLVDDMSTIPSAPPNYKNCIQEDELKSLNAARAAAAAAAMGAALGLHFNTPGVGETYHHHTPAPIISCSPGRPKGSASANYNATNHALLDIYPKLESSAAGDAIVARPYQCATCSRSFAVKAGLMQHLRTHTDERPYPCPECGRAFKQKIQLTTHMRVHSGERPYGCRICGKLFRQQSHVVQHLRTHTGEKPHKCGRCNKAFRQKYSLISHQRRMCQSRASSNSMIAGMTMWIGPAGGATVGSGGFANERTTFESGLSAHAREGQGERVETFKVAGEAKTEAAVPNSHSEDHSSLSNRSCSSPASSHELALTSDGGGDGGSKSADLCTLSYHQQEKQMSPDSNPHLHPHPHHHHSPRISAAGSPYVDVADRSRRSYMDSEYTSFANFPNSDHMRLNGAFPGCLEDPVESTL